ncbi:MAG: hypothetical protein JW760_00155 [Spirochaetales bacterium]|nr:hypothetical protein [Spirochaetales bacterium]
MYRIGFWKFFLYLKVSFTPSPGCINTVLRFQSLGSGADIISTIIMADQGLPAHSTPHPLRRKDDRVLTDGVELKGISEEDKHEIYENIDRVVENNRIPITKELLSLKPKKKGAAFPLTINILAVLAVGAAFILSNRLFEQRQQALSLETEQYLSAEGKLIEQLKKESEEKLQAKDAEIGKIQEELAELDRRSADLQANMESTIRARETELRAELEEALEAERARLQATGASTEDIEKTLEEFERQRRAEYESLINNFRAEAEAEIRAKEEELEQAKALNRDFLARMNAEKADLQDELTRQEAELSSRYQAEMSALEQETSEAQAKLAELAKQSESQQLLRDQITSGYMTIKNQIEKEDYTAALQSLESLKTIISDTSLAASPNLAKQMEAEGFILETLKRDIESKTYKEDTDTSSMVEAAEALLAAREIARRGAEAMESGNPEEAEDYYTRALASLPAIHQAYKDLETIRQNTVSETLATRNAAALTFLAAGNHEAALAEFRTALLSGGGEFPEAYSQTVKGLEESMTARQTAALATKDRQLAAKTAEDKKALESLKSELEAQIAALEEELAGLETLLSENEEKLALSQEDLAAVKEQHEAALKELQDLHTQELTEKDAAFEEEKIKLTTEIEGLNEKVQNLTAEIKASGEEIAGLRSIMAVYKELTADYLKQKTSLESFLASDSANQAKNLYRDFMRSEGETLFPGVAELWENLSDLLMKEARSEGTSEGRTEAFGDIRLFTDYLSGNAPRAAEEIQRLAAAEPAYGDTVGEIQRLAEGSFLPGTGTESALPRQSRFIGTISYILDERIVIERLIAFEASVGDTLTIKRKLPGGKDEVLAEGVISYITPQKVEAIIETVRGDRSPQVMDLVYLIAD